jgi:protein-tyrosine phosphatase
MKEALNQIRRLQPADGGLVLGPRPGKKSKTKMSAMGLSHVCTLLSEHEKPAIIEKIANELGCRWLWLPISGGHLDVLRALDLEAMISQLAASITETAAPRIYLHCAAGIHRTGFFASVLLRLQPVADVEASLVALRPVTAQQLGQDRLALAILRAEALLRDV